MGTCKSRTRRLQRTGLPGTKSSFDKHPLKNRGLLTRNDPGVHFDRGTRTEGPGRNSRTRRWAHSGRVGGVFLFKPFLLLSLRKHVRGKAQTEDTLAAEVVIVIEPWILSKVFTCVMMLRSKLERGLFSGLFELLQYGHVASTHFRWFLLSVRPSDCQLNGDHFGMTSLSLPIYPLTHSLSARGWSLAPSVGRSPRLDGMSNIFKHGTTRSLFWKRKAHSITA